MDKPEALRLADALSVAIKQVDVDDDVIHVARWFVGDAAAELRRLHEAHDWQYKMAGERLHRVEKLEAQRDVLLQALKALVQNEGLEPYSYLDKGIGTATAAGQRWLNARAVVKAVEGEKNHGQA